jgi:hypothetical protein
VFRKGVPDGWFGTFLCDSNRHNQWQIATGNHGFMGSLTKCIDILILLVVFTDELRIDRRNTAISTA